MTIKKIMAAALSAVLCVVLSAAARCGTVGTVRARADLQCCSVVAQDSCPARRAGCRRTAGERGPG